MRDSFIPMCLKCPREYECVKKIGIFIKEKFDSKLSKQGRNVLGRSHPRILEEYAQKEENMEKNGLLSSYFYP